MLVGCERLCKSGVNVSLNMAPGEIGILDTVHTLKTLHMLFHPVDKVAWCVRQNGEVRCARIEDVMIIGPAISEATVCFPGVDQGNTDRAAGISDDGNCGSMGRKARADNSNPECLVSQWQTTP